MSSETQRWKMVRIPPLTSRESPIESKNQLEVKFQFDSDTAAKIREALGPHVSGKLVRNALRIKGMGFRKEEISEVAIILGYEAGDLSKWEPISGMLEATGRDAKLAIAAFRAGISPSQFASMAPESRTLERLNLMADVHSF